MNTLFFSWYGAGKLAEENYLAVFAKQLPSVRKCMFNVCGLGQDMENLCQWLVSNFLAQAFKGAYCGERFT